MAGMGFLYLIITFAICFLIVHTIRLAYLGFISLRAKPEEERTVEKKTEPVYYIVERKKTKKKFSEPKEISFK